MIRLNRSWQVLVNGRSSSNFLELLICMSRAVARIFTMTSRSFVTRKTGNLYYVSVRTTDAPFLTPLRLHQEERRHHILSLSSSLSSLWSSLCKRCRLMCLAEFSHFAFLCLVDDNSFLFLLSTVIFDFSWFMIIIAIRYLKILLNQKCTISVLWKIPVLVISHRKMRLLLRIIGNFALFTTINWADLWALLWLARLLRLLTRTLTLSSHRGWLRDRLAVALFWLLRLFVFFFTGLFFPLAAWWAATLAVLQTRRLDIFVALCLRHHLSPLVIWVWPRQVQSWHERMPGPFILKRLVRRRDTSSCISTPITLVIFGFLCSCMETEVAITGGHVCSILP